MEDITHPAVHGYSVSGRGGESPTT
jgi:hypothetical protein